MTNSQKPNGPTKSNLVGTIQRATSNEFAEVNSIEALIDQFEHAGQDSPNGDKVWLASNLQLLLGYQKWGTFEQAITRAMTACTNAGHQVKDHFQEVSPSIGKTSKRGRSAKDFKLDRYACYLIAQNASSSMRQVAFAQTYFAIQTRRQELADRDGVDFDTFSENQKRFYLRNQVVDENKRLARAAKTAGVTTNNDFGKFQNRGYQGLYGGRKAEEIKSYKHLPKKANILDHMGSTELAANLFRITQTEEKLRSKNIMGKENACNAHYEVGKKVRQAMQELSGIMPEDLPAAEDVRKIARQERKQQRIHTVKSQNRVKQPLTTSQETQLVEIDLAKDLWKYALLIMSIQPNGEIATATLIDKLPEYIALSAKHLATNKNRRDSKFSQRVRNLKSHKTSKSNFIYKGYAEAIKGGFRITPQGLEFVWNYFSEQPPLNQRQ